MANTKLTTKSATKSSETKKSAILKKNLKSFVDQGSYNQRVEQKAYELYLQRGGNHGNDWNDWFEAEKIVSAEVK